MSQFQILADIAFEILTKKEVKFLCFQRVNKLLIQLVLYHNGIFYKKIHPNPRELNEQEPKWKLTSLKPSENVTVIGQTIEIKKISKKLKDCISFFTALSDNDNSTYNSIV